ncbi:MAG: ribosome-associated translation inhibitor RaiA [Candidatus Omnitrophica bacterium]|nr:ribosome-associated translation inhibitor RaiA [Candidatus Omnitrophota bacterium]
MRVTITARHTEVPGSIKEILESKVDKLEHFGHKLIALHAVFDKEKYNYTVELTLYGKGISLVGKAKNKRDFLTCMEEALMKLKQQLTRRESKMQEKNKRLIRRKKMYAVTKELP